MAKPIIGLDFGNYNTFTCYISGIDPGSRMGGMVYDLLPAKQQEGIPSVFFYSKKVGVLCGEEAVRPRARPADNRVRYLKRHLGETLELDGEQLQYDDAITQVVQHCVRRANTQLMAGWLQTTNLVSLSYPATYTFAQRQRLIELVERATLEDGTKIQVSGTIAEPAAAALDYLAEYAKEDKETTILTYDLGGGTFDLALVAAYPKGRKNSEGNLYYYDIINTRGIAKLGGAEFDEVVYRLLAGKVRAPLSRSQERELRSMAEQTKIELSTSEEELPQLMVGDDYLDLPITRKEFEEGARGLLAQTIEKTRELLEDHPNQPPEVILLTGGASQMPMVKRGLEEAFPKYRGKIIDFRPSRAIAYGAARFGTAERNPDPALGGGPVVQQRTMYEIGVRYYRTQEDEDGFIQRDIAAGTPIPCEGPFKGARTLKSGQFLRFAVYEAKGQHPDPERVKRDYTEIMEVILDYGEEVPQMTPAAVKLSIDKLGRLVIEARDPSRKDRPVVKNSVKLKNLS